MTPGMGAVTTTTPLRTAMTDTVDKGQTITVEMVLADSTGGSDTLSSAFEVPETATVALSELKISKCVRLVIIIFKGQLPQPAGWSRGLLPWRRQ